MWKWIVGGAAALYVGPMILRRLAKNPQILDQGASLLDETRMATERTLKAGAKIAAKQSEALLKDLQARQKKAKKGVNGLGLPPADHATRRGIARSEAEFWATTANSMLMSGLPKATKCEQVSAVLDNAFFNFGVAAGHGQDKNGTLLPAAQTELSTAQMTTALAANTFRQVCVAGGSGKMPKITNYGSGTPTIRF
jgi:hypothetical protein